MSACAYSHSRHNHPYLHVPYRGGEGDALDLSSIVPIAKNIEG
jgi:hypothetical protein